MPSTCRPSTPSTRVRTPRQREGGADGPSVLSPRLTHRCVSAVSCLVVLLLLSLCVCVVARHAIIYNSRLSKDAKWLLCLPGGLGVGPNAPLSVSTCGTCCNMMQWDKLNARSFVRVYEN